MLCLFSYAKKQRKKPKPALQTACGLREIPCDWQIHWSSVELRSELIDRSSDDELHAKQNTHSYFSTSTQMIRGGGSACATNIYVPIGGLAASCNRNTNYRFILTHALIGYCFYSNRCLCHLNRYAPSFTTEKHTIAATVACSAKAVFLRVYGRSLQC